MTEIGQRLPISPDDAPPPRPPDANPAVEDDDATGDPWHLLLGLQDRHRYLRILEPRPEDSEDGPDDHRDDDRRDEGRPDEEVCDGPDGDEEPTDAAEADRTANSGDDTRPPLPPSALDLDAALPRAAHRLLRSPAAMTRTATNSPRPHEVADYLAHSADLTSRGGLAGGVSAPLAVCALAEHYILRRIGGSSAGAVVAAASAAAELGRTVPPPEPARADAVRPETVQPGFAGLAGMLGWLAGQDVPAAAGEPYRLARMMQPSRGTRDAHRALIALARLPLSKGFRARAVPLLAGLFAGFGRAARVATTLVALGAVLAWIGSTAAMIRSPMLPLPLALLTSVAVLGTLALAVLAAAVISCLVTLRGHLGDDAEAEHFGLIPGIRLPDMDFVDATGDGSSSHRGSLLDRLVGVPAADGVPALATWVTDRIDDLAGIPSAATEPRQEPGIPGRLSAALDERGRPALTFGELWLGRLGPITAEDLPLLRRAADNPGLRCIDLVLTATNISQNRPYTLPFVAAERAERDGGSRFLFCRSCLTAVLPARVVSQMVIDSPAQARESTCPRHDGELLQEVPEPWDFPVAAAVRMSMSLPGLLRAVPFCTLDVETHGPLQDRYGAVVAPPPPPPSVFVPRVHWFCDGDLTGTMPVHHFDTLLPRWPTFALTLEGLRTDPDSRFAEWVDVPEQDAAPRSRPWRRVSGASTFLGALGGTVTNWRDTVQATTPGYRGRMAVVRGTGVETLSPLFMNRSTILRLALRGYRGGVALRERFTGSDGAGTGQTQTDRYRWIRMRMALRQYRELSLDIGARLPLYSDLAASYRVPEALTTWFTPPIAPGSIDPAWPDAAAAVTHLRALSTGGVLDWDTDYGAPPLDPDLHPGPAN